MKHPKGMAEIRRHGAGWQASVRVVGHKPSIKQFPLRTSPAEMQRWRKDERARLHTKTPPSVAGTFAGDVPRYLEARKAMPGIAQRTRQMAIWAAAKVSPTADPLGAKPSLSIESWEIQTMRDRWLTEGPRLQVVPGGTRKDPRFVELAEPLGASQVNQRLRALENFFTVMYPGRPNPVRAVAEAEEPDPEERGLPYAVIEAILAQVPERGRPDGSGKRPKVSLTKRRLAVIAYAGLAHCELMRITPADLHLNESMPWVWIQGRRKGKGTRGTPQPLTEYGVEAIRALVDAGGLGPFSPSSMRMTLRRACAKLDLKNIRPYDFRHSFASEVLERTEGNLPVTQLMMRHKDQRTTKRYTLRAIDPVRAAAIERIQKAGGFK